ncbi:MAG: hypothetical protein AAF231_10460, partial [Pseudomonadota bacterium]
ISEAIPVHVIEMGGLEAFEVVQSPRMQANAATECLPRDLIKMTAFDKGPEDLEAAAPDESVPMICTVCRAAVQAPRLINSRWDNGRPKQTRVCKGVWAQLEKLSKGLKL